MELHWQEGLEASLQFRLALILCDPVASGIHFCCPASCLESILARSGCRIGRV
ncbi:hypothetical protein BDV34DRAFT_188051 [Aspergillus parasiticus]|uniref:Uncharacterized protein n=1 Tax=Aspergillus parasiticus TaxID=5067 RepID=A0A5N6DXQ6_ASPPA|nr:hypothetical protein BDV34DRAFT_188051 [Aspergillus parasiticus]